MGSQAWDLLDVFSINSLLKLIKNCLKLLSNENNKLIVYSNTKEVFSLKNKLQPKNIIEAYYKVDRLLSDLNGMWSSMKYLYIHIRQRSGYGSMMHTFKANEYNPLHELCKFYCKWRLWKIFVCIQLFHLLSDNKHEFKTKQMLLNYLTI